MLKENDGQLTADGIFSMKYMEQVLLGNINVSPAPIKHCVND